jgi:DNA-binding LytR/AlgR family response regulator
LSYTESIMSLSCVIIEDESISRAMIEGLAQKTGFLSVKESFASSSQALHWLNENNVDLIFLDVEMPEISGIELLQALIYKPAVIIISSNPKYAIDAFQFSVIDYLLKPVNDYGRFLQAVTKVASRLKNDASGTELVSEHHLYVRIDSILHKIAVEDILWIEAFGDYIKIQTKEKLQTTYGTLKKIEERLPAARFVRVHRSFIVNLEKISNIDSNNLIIDKKIIPISENYKSHFLARIKIL